MFGAQQKTIGFVIDCEKLDGTMIQLPGYWQIRADAAVHYRRAKKSGNYKTVTIVTVS